MKNDFYNKRKSIHLGPKKKKTSLRELIEKNRIEFEAKVLRREDLKKDRRDNAIVVVIDEHEALHNKNEQQYNSYKKKVEEKDKIVRDEIIKERSELREKKIKEPKSNNDPGIENLIPIRPNNPDLLNFLNNLQ